MNWICPECKVITGESTSLSPLPKVCIKCGIRLEPISSTSKAIDTRTRSQRVSDWVCHFSGSWSCIAFFAVFTAVWMVFNVYGWWYHFDPYPFILLNGVFTVVELFQGPLILLSENRQQERDRENIRLILEAIHEMKDK